MKKPVIICIDDEPTVLESLKIELRKAVGEDCIIETAQGGYDALELMTELKEENIEVALVVSDYIMPDMKGDEVLKRIHEMSPTTLKVMLTGQADLEAVGRAIRHARLYRYIAKPWQQEDLKLTVVEAVHSYLLDKKLDEQNKMLLEMNRQLEELTVQQADIIAARTSELRNTNEQLQMANEELRKMVDIDGMTGIANRRRFNDYLGEQWEEMIERKQHLSLILIDVDFFKYFNDNYGHVQGDECLRLVASAIDRVLPKSEDLVARYGGEEFAVILPNSLIDEAIKVAEGIRTEIRNLKIDHKLSRAYPYVTVSVGVSGIVPHRKVDPKVLVATADMALYEAKQRGRDRVVKHDL